MKKTLICSILCLVTTGVFSQSYEVIAPRTISPDVEQSPNVAPYHPGSFSNRATWDIQYSSNLTTATNGGVGMAAVAFYNNEFWVSFWATDTLARFTSAGTLIGKFVIPGLIGTRAITTDGTYLYVGTAGGTIYRVDPGTQTLAPPHITSASTGGCRFVSYDPTLDGGSGGFWTGNFNTDIFAVDMSGAVLSSIPAATHTLTGMYGAAVDNVSFGGPYLWVFHQGGANATQITGIDLNTGAPSAYSVDAFTDFSTTYSLTSGLAGGMFFTDQLVTGENSLIGLIQGTPNNVVFAYELDIIAGFEDLEALGATPQKGYTQIPLSQVFNEVFDIEYRNGGTVPVDTLFVDVNYKFNGSVVSSETMFALGVASTGTGILTTSGFTPSNGVGSYEVEAIVRPDVNYTDSDPLNDTTVFGFEVTYGMFARDNGIETGTGYVVSAVDWAYASSIYELAVGDTVTGIWIQITGPVDGDTTYPAIHNFNGTLPTTINATGDTTIISSAQTQYMLNFSTPVILTADTYAFGCYEGSNTGINLAQSTSVYTAGTNFFYVGPTALWSASGIQTARFIRPVFSANSNAISENGKAVFTVYPVPADESLTVSFAEPVGNGSTLYLFESNGRIVMDKNLTPGTTQFNLGVESLSQGIYVMVISTDKGMVSKKIVIR